MTWQGCLSALTIALRPLYEVLYRSRPFATHHARKLWKKALGSRGDLQGNVFRFGRKQTLVISLALTIYLSHQFQVVTDKGIFKAIPVFRSRMLELAGVRVDRISDSKAVADRTLADG